MSASSSSSGLRHAKLRCIGCELTSRKVTREHFWPRWLAQRANLASDPRGVAWFGKKHVSAARATIPLCKDCNHTFGRELESPVAHIFRSMEDGEGLTDHEAELLARWLWKFEGFSWSLLNPQHRYSERWTVRERVLGNAFQTIRSLLTLAVCFFKHNNDGHTALPVGIDSGVGEKNSIFISGVFCKTAVMISLRECSFMIPKQFSLYDFPIVPDPSGRKRFFPATTLETGADAIRITTSASRNLVAAHEAWATIQQAQQPLIGTRPRVELPVSSIVMPRR